MGASGSQKFCDGEIHIAAVISVIPDRFDQGLWKSCFICYAQSALSKERASPPRVTTAGCLSLSAFAGDFSGGHPDKTLSLSGEILITH
jgi:hypothetical protein